MDKSTALRRLLRGDRPVVLAGAHNGLSAKLVEEAGFDGVWASGFEISASHGVPDASLLPMTDHLSAAEAMNDGVGVPVVVDGDTGYGNAINAMRATRAYERAGAAALCIEDAVFPKRCSFYTGVPHDLAPIDEHALKIRACCDARTTPEFMVIARTEAFVAGRTLAEALARGHAYADAGADAVLVHSRQPTPDEIAAFARTWTRDVPLVCVPTTYASASVDDLWSLGYRMVIFANHGLRAAIPAVRRTLAELRRTGCAATVDAQIAPLSDVYRLVGVDSLKTNERTYLPARNKGE